jgi:hypothetical protein
MMEPLTGKELIAAVDSMPQATKSELCMATGYVRERDGKVQRQFSRFYRALLQAKGQHLPSERGNTEGAGRPLSYCTTVLSHGGILLGKRYVESMGLAHGDQAEIEVARGCVKLRPRRSES